MDKTVLIVTITSSILFLGVVLLAIVFWYLNSKKRQLYNNYK